jgi:hypothetical protein
MALRHAVQAALLDEELSGYQLVKAFDMGVANFWHALPQQLYLEPAKLEKVQAADHVDAGEVIAQLLERAAFADAKIELFGGLLRQMRGDRDEAEFLRHGERVGPYLTCLRGLAFEQGDRDWCRRSAAILRERRTAHVQR